VVDAWDRVEEPSDPPQPNSPRRPPWIKVVGALLIVALTVGAGIRGNWIALAIGAVLILVTTYSAVGLRREKRRQTS